MFGDISRDGWGGFAEFVCARETSFSLKKASLSFEQAAAIPQAATLALQSLRDKGKIRSGQRVLINGAGGGVGTFAVQIAKSFGAEVTGVDRAEKLDMLLSIGADHVIDYAKEDFTRSGQEYDLIVDVVSHRSVFDYKRALAPKGICVLVGGSGGAVFESLLLGSWALGNRKVTLLLYKPNPRDLTTIGDLIEAGKVVPVIDRSIPAQRGCRCVPILCGRQRQRKDRCDRSMICNGIFLPHTHLTSMIGRSYLLLVQFWRAGQYLREDPSFRLSQVLQKRWLADVHLF